jgi:hypothetical protein
MSRKGLKNDGFEIMLTFMKDYAEQLRSRNTNDQILIIRKMANTICISLIVLLKPSLMKNKELIIRETKKPKFVEFVEMVDKVASKIVDAILE